MSQKINRWENPILFSIAFSLFTNLHYILTHKNPAHLSHTCFQLSPRQVILLSDLTWAFHPRWAFPLPKVVQLVVHWLTHFYNKTFSMLQEFKPWPATIELISEWVTQRIFGGDSSKQGQAQCNTIASYLSSLRSYHIDHYWSVTVFEKLRLARILQGGWSFFSKVKKDFFPITKEILERITAIVPIIKDDFNIDTAFKIVWLDFWDLEKLFILLLTSKNPFLSTWMSHDPTFYSPKMTSTLYSISNGAKPISSIQEFRLFYQLQASRHALSLPFAVFLLTLNNQHLPHYSCYHIPLSVKLQFFLS